MGCHGIHAFSNSPNRFIFGEHFFSNNVGPREQFGTHDKLSQGCKEGQIKSRFETV